MKLIEKKRIIKNKITELVAHNNKVLDKIDVLKEKNCWYNRITLVNGHMYHVCFETYKQEVAYLHGLDVALDAIKWVDKHED